jgi:HSP20 family protein
MPTTQPTNPATTEAAGVEQAIHSVEALYRAVTGSEPADRETSTPGSPIPVEMNPGQFVEEQLARLLALLESQVEGQLGRTSSAPWHPLLSVAEDDGELIAQLDVPGVDRRDLEVRMSGNALLIRGRRKAEPAGKPLRLSERPQGAFSRQLLLSPALKLGEPRAQLKDGVLEIRIAKEGQPAEAASKAVPIN